MNFKKLTAALIFSAAPLLATAQSDEQPSIADNVSNLEMIFNDSFPNLNYRSITPTPLAGIYEIETQRNGFIYTNYDLSFFLEGDLYSTSLGEIKNLTEMKKSLRRLDELASMPSESIISFKPEDGQDVKATINVFTDVDCGYCRKFHKEVPALNAMGVQVNYLAFPRAGVGSPTYNKMVSAWCASDPNTAMTALKSGKPVQVQTCETRIEDQLMLGQQLGVTGTPSIVLDSGQIIPGYLPADKMSALLKLDQEPNATAQTPVDEEPALDKS